MTHILNVSIYDSFPEDGRRNTRPKVRGCQCGNKSPFQWPRKYGKKTDSIVDKNWELIILACSSPLFRCVNNTFKK